MSSTSQTDGVRKPFKAASDLSAKQYYIVKATSNYLECDLSSAATDFILGALQNAPKAGDAADIGMIHGGGTFKVILGGTVSIGSALTADSAGKAVATTTTGNYLLGRALKAGDAGDIIEVLPCGNNRYAATS